MHRKLERGKRWWWVRGERRRGGKERAGKRGLLYSFIWSPVCFKNHLLLCFLKGAGPPHSRMRWQKEHFLIQRRCISRHLGILFAKRKWACGSECGEEGVATGEGNGDGAPSCHWAAPWRRRARGDHPESSSTLASVRPKLGRVALETSLSLSC